MSAPDQIRLVFWNTFLLHPHPIPGGPGLPPIAELAAPAVPERATAIGAALGRRFDIAALAEAFEPADHDRVKAAWGNEAVRTATGPARSLLRGPLGFASSGLLTLVDHHRIARRATHRFRTRGSYLHDADALSNKGVLLVEVDLGLGETGGNLELYSTHLCWGTGLLPGGRAADPHRRHRVRMAQVDELVRFVERTHRPGNVIIVVGDMNVPAVRPTYPDGPTVEYDDLVARLGSLGLVDLWTLHGSGAGATCGAKTDAFADQADPDDPDALVDDDALLAAADPAHLAERERIDHVFLAEPDPTQRVRIEATSIRRYAFPRPPGAPKADQLVRLSDHLAVGVDLSVSSV